MASIAKRFYSNDWKYPNDKFAPHERHLKVNLRKRKRIGPSLNFPKLDWDRACSVVDGILNIILTELRRKAKNEYEGLEIQTNFIRQASARQGLKVDVPDEFDIIVPFKIQGLRYQEVCMTDHFGQNLPGQIRLRVEDSTHRFPSLKRAGVFKMKSGTYFINTKALQERVFKSLMDKTLHDLNLKIDVFNVSYATFATKRIKRGCRPPTINLEIDGDELPKACYVDVVFALVLSRETISIPGSVLSSVDTKIKFQRYGLMKWVNKTNWNIDESDKNFIWRSCSSSYERFMFDLCDGNDESGYIKTSCRVMKALIEQLRRRQNIAAILLSSYHLKTITMYCILLLTVPSKLTSSDSKISGVREALGYFLTFLEMVLERKCLPDFFLGNEYLRKIFPRSYFTNIELKYNLFDKEDPVTVEAAKYDFPEIKKELAGCFEVENLNARVINFFKEKTLNVKEKDPQEEKIRVWRMLNSLIDESNVHSFLHAINSSFKV